MFHRLKEKKGNKNMVSFQLKELFKHLESKKGSATTNEVTKALDIINGKLLNIFIHLRLIV